MRCKLTAAAPGSRDPTWRAHVRFNLVQSEKVSKPARSLRPLVTAASAMLIFIYPFFQLVFWPMMYFYSPKISQDVKIMRAARRAKERERGRREKSVGVNDLLREFNEEAEMPS